MIELYCLRVSQFNSVYFIRGGASSAGHVTAATPNSDQQIFSNNRSRESDQEAEDSRMKERQ